MPIWFYGRGSRARREKPHQLQQQQQSAAEMAKLWAQAKQQHDIQEQSPLFNQLPAELRNEIFLLALTEYEDMSRAYDREAYYCKPSYRGPRRVDVALLRTCKLAWLETRYLPFRSVLDAPMTFFLTQQDRHPPEYRRKSALQTLRAKKLTYKQWDSIHTIRVFMQGLTNYNLRKIFRSWPQTPQIQTIIIRTSYTDWYNWETCSPLFLDGEQMSLIRLPATVTKVNMELEMIESREAELNALIERVFQQEQEYRWTCAQSGEILKVAHLDDPWAHVPRWTWVGPTRFEGLEFDHHPAGDSMVYVLRTVSWQR